MLICLLSCFRVVNELALRRTRFGSFRLREFLCRHINPSTYILPITPSIRNAIPEFARQLCPHLLEGTVDRYTTGGRRPCQERCYEVLKAKKPACDYIFQW